MSRVFGKTLMIANPIAKNGTGKEAAYAAEKQLNSFFDADNFTMVMTENPGHAYELAKKSGSYNTVIVLGGDGVVHETANGLMSIPEKVRPVFGVLPVGSGNDYAHTLGMSFDLDKAIPQLLNAQVKELDIGFCNGEYFVESLSFGLDAAIAHDSTKRRIETGKTGNALYFASGLDMLTHQRHTYDYTLAIQGEPETEHQMIMFAVQIGCTYGGGFNVCPDAIPDDGLFDICIGHAPMGFFEALIVFISAKEGKHTRFKKMEFLKTDSLILNFPHKIPPAQLDGEVFQGTKFEIKCLKKAVKVLVPH